MGMDFLGQVRSKARYCYYWLTGLWHVFGLIKHSNFDFEAIEETTKQFADSVKNRRREIEDLPDSKLKEIFLSESSSRYERALAEQTYTQRHGISLFVDIAIADTDRFLQLQQDPKFDDPKVQEAYFAQHVGQLLSKVKLLDKKNLF